MKNREWLNNLSNEDLAYLMTSCEICVYASKGCMEHDEWNCYEGCVKWLEQEYEGSENE